MNPPKHPHSPRGLVVLGAFLLLATLITGCASSGKDVTGFDSVTLAPGDTGNCDSSPCQVYLKMPAGTGSYEVTANEVSVGTFPAGQTAFLGSFWQSQAFQIRGMDLPKAYAWIPEQR
jgi:hypothetical protein